MHSKKKVLAISGSTRQNSSNHNLIKAITALFSAELEILLFNNVADLPHFNPDNNFNNTPQEVTDFRAQVKNCDAVIICTPEYAHGIPGSLKNAIDWTVSSGGFSNKPTALITASTDGTFAHQALLEVLKTIEAKNIDQLHLQIQFIRTKFDTENTLKDEATITAVKKLITDLIKTIDATA